MSAAEACGRCVFVVTCEDLEAVGERPECDAYFTNLASSLQLKAET
jgi:hypothetical protein